MIRINPGRAILASATVLTAACWSHAQYAISWSAVSCGGNTDPIAAGPYTLQSTIGDPLASSGGASGQYGIGSGFLQEGGGGTSTCYANCDGSTTTPVLNVNDFICFQNRFAAGDPWANCDGSTSTPILNVNDFVCFQNRFASGCP